MNRKASKMVKARQSSLEMPDQEVRKKQDVLTKARNKFLNLSDALKHKNPEGHLQAPTVPNAPRRSMTQATLEYFFKNSSNRDKNQIYANTSNLQQQQQEDGIEINNTKRSNLQKQFSVGSYPIRIEVSDEDDNLKTITRLRPATVCVDKVSEGRETAALALERPRKKLSFREPEILGYSLNAKSELVPKKYNKKLLVPEVNGILLHTPSVDNIELESQAMRVVRTVGQAFEVCHKLSINAPENENLDQDEQDTLTQDLLSDRFSDNISDKPKKDLLSEGASDRQSLPPDDGSYKGSTVSAENNRNAVTRPPQLDILPPPPPNSNTRKSPLTSAETYASPHSDALTSGSGSAGSNSLPPAGSALSAHHEIQLLREQLDQQSQQTQAAMAQLQLAREQLAAEQSARLEAQARTHQLLVHNRELLDHIAALVAHLQGGEKSATQQTPPHVTMPQQQQHPGPPDNYMSAATDHSETGSLDNSPVFQALGLNPQGLIENRAVTSCLPSSPLRTTFNPGGPVYNFAYPPQVDTSFEAQLLQRLQTLSGYTPPNAFPYNYNQQLQFLQPAIYNPPPQLLNNNYSSLPHAAQKFQHSPQPVRHSFGEQERRMSPGRNSEPRQIVKQTSPQYQSQQNLYQAGPQSNQQNQQRLQVQQQNVTQRQSSPMPQQTEGQFIKPLSQIGTLTTTDPDGRVRVIVPVPSNSNEDAGNLLANLRLNDELRVLNGPPITRSTSEKVPNRSELMSQVQRTAWARHTTK